MSKIISLIFLLSLMLVSCKKAENDSRAVSDSLALTLDSDGDGIPDATDGSSDGTGGTGGTGTPNGAAGTPSGTVTRIPGSPGCKGLTDGEETILIPISGKAVYNTTYCSGAAPSKEMYAQASKWKPLINAEVIFQSGEKEVRLTTDGKGAFAADLCEGKWSYYVTSNMDEGFTDINKSCEKYFSKSYGVITVNPGGKNMNYQLQYHFDCDPCDPNSKKRQ